jgi:hypothetical protein
LISCSLEEMPGSEKLKSLCAFFSVGIDLGQRFLRFVRLLEALYGVSLPLPQRGVDLGPCPSSLKEFCCSLIEGNPHPWRSATKRLSSDKRRSFAMSVFLYRKVLPNPKPELSSYLDRMSQPDDPSSEEFKAFCRVQVRKMFPDGWDTVMYPDAALSSTIPESSCFQRGMAKGGCRSFVLEGGVSWCSHQAFVERVLASENPCRLSPSRVSAVETGGKWRIVSVADAEMNILRPLHTAIYNRLSRFGWLLRGEAKSASFQKFTSCPGQVFVSGDYTSATDNLNMGVQREILYSLLEGARSVPTGVKSLALQSQQISLLEPCGKSCLGCARCRVVLQNRGQLMGNLLSFPLLCLVNYLAFRFFAGLGSEHLPVKVNGDDIVFRSSPEVYERWAAGVQGAGLALSPGKTMVDSRYFSLNSKIFRSRASSVRMLPVIRSSAFGFKTPEDPVASFRGRWERVRADFPCGKGLLHVLGVEFLKLNVRYVVASRRSITRGLDSLFPPSAIQACNLWKRECWYLSLSKEDPLPLSPDQRGKLRIPHGWHCARVERVSKEVREISRGIGPEFVAQAWTPYDDPGEAVLAARKKRYEEEVAMAPFYRARDVLPVSKKARLLHLSTANVKRYLAPCVVMGHGVEKNPHVIVRSYRPRGRRVWLPTGFTSFSLQGARTSGCLPGFRRGGIYVAG